MVKIVCSGEGWIGRPDKLLNPQQLAAKREATEAAARMTEGAVKFGVKFTAWERKIGNRYKWVVEGC